MFVQNVNGSAYGQLLCKQCKTSRLMWVQRGSWHILRPVKDAWTLLHVAVELRMQTLCRKLILRKWRLKFLYDFDVLRRLRCRLPVVHL